MKKIMSIIGAALASLLRPIDTFFWERSPLVARAVGFAATFGDQKTLTLEATADLSGKQYHFLRYAGTHTTNQASDATNSSIAGVLQTKPTSGRAACVAYEGLSKLVAGDAITVNAILTTNASGRAVAVASGQMGLAKALEAAGADGEVISALLFPPVRWAGAA